jgi:hypothetical protein
MLPHPTLFERECQHRLDEHTADVNRLRLIREAKAGRRETAPSQSASPHIQGGLQSILAAMTRLWSSTAQ